MHKASAVELTNGGAKFHQHSLQIYKNVVQRARGKPFKYRRMIATKDYYNVIQGRILSNIGLPFGFSSVLLSIPLGDRVGRHFHGFRLLSGG